MPDIKLRDGSGVENTYQGVDTITLPLADGSGNWTFGLTDEDLAYDTYNKQGPYIINGVLANIFNKLLLILIIMFLCLYSISVMGYKDKRQETKTLYTEEMIRKFESDVEKGKEIDINDYFTYEDVDYSNKSSDLGEEISKSVDYVSSKSLEFMSNLFTYLFD